MSVYLQIKFLKVSVAELEKLFCTLSPNTCHQTRNIDHILRTLVGHSRTHWHVCRVRLYEHPVVRDLSETLFLFLRIKTDISRKPKMGVRKILSPLGNLVREPAKNSEDELAVQFP